MFDCRCKVCLFGDALRDGRCLKVNDSFLSLFIPPTSTTPSLSHSAACPSCFKTHHGSRTRCPAHQRHTSPLRDQTPTQPPDLCLFRRRVHHVRVASLFLSARTFCLYTYPTNLYICYCSNSVKVHEATSVIKLNTKDLTIQNVSIAFGETT